MTDRHKDQGPDVYVRGPVPEKADAQRILAAENLQLKGFVIACLRALIADPKRFLKQLERHWPEAKHAGRPPKPPAVELVSEPFEDPA